MRVGLGVVCVLLALLVVVWTQQRRLMYFPFGSVPSPEAVGLTGVSAVSFRTSDDVTLSGWFIARTDAPRLTVIVFNGNAGNRAFRAPLAAAITRENFAVFLFDYRGFGGNPGSPSEAGLQRDARAAREFVIARLGVNQRALVYFGESLGTAVATELAVEHPPAALVLRSPFTSMTDVGREHYPMLPVRWLLRDRYTTIERIARVDAPVLVIGGDRDRIVPIEQTRRVFEAAREPKRLLVISGADHNDDSLLAGRELIGELLRFLRELPAA